MDSLTSQTIRFINRQKRNAAIPACDWALYATALLASIVLWRVL